MIGGCDKVLSNQVLNRTISDIYRITDINCSIWSMEGKCLVSTCSDNSHVKEKVQIFLEKVAESYEIKEINEIITKKGAFFLVQDEDKPSYVLAFHESMDNVDITGRLCVCQLEHLIRAYKTRVDRNRFFQNLLLDNLLLVDIHNQAKKINVDTEGRRSVFVIQPKQEADSLVLETMRGLYTVGTKDFVTSVDESQIVLIKNLENTEDYKELNSIAKTIVDMLNTEVMVSVRVAYGTIVDNLKDVSKSYKEATMALDVGRVFYAEKNVLAYNELGIGRLIHQLPISLCEMFLKEVFSGNAIEQFDEETLSTVNLFFNNNLNISETARKLYVHRNTLVYRLEKIQKTTGLDVRVFDDALTFKIALMVSKHMKAMQSK